MELTLSQPFFKVSAIFAKMDSFFSAFASSLEVSPLPPTKNSDTAFQRVRKKLEILAAIPPNFSETSSLDHRSVRKVHAVLANSAVFDLMAGSF